MCRPTLGKRTLGASQDPQDQPADHVLAFPGGAQVAVEQELVEPVGRGARRKRQRPGCLVKMLGHLGGDLAVF